MRNNARMSKMRTILQKLMEEAGHNSYDLAKRAGLQPSTISRYLNGMSHHLRPETVTRIGKIYGLTESQMRGDMPTPGLGLPRQLPELRDILPVDEYDLITHVKAMDEEARKILFILAEKLAREQNTHLLADSSERRREDIYPNPQLRIGETRHKATPTKIRRKNTDGRNYRTYQKPYQTA